MTTETIPKGTLVIFSILTHGNLYPHDNFVGVVTGWYPGDFEAMYLVKSIGDGSIHTRTEDMLHICAYSFNNL